MLSNPVTLSLDDSFPKEMLEHILSYLPPKDLLNAEQVKKRWQLSANQTALWQGLINLHFPYLQEKKKQQYKENPKSLFQKKLQEIEEKIKEHSEYSKIRPILLSSLRGDIQKIETTTISDEAKQILFSYAVYNGHLDAICKLTECACDLLRKSAKNGRHVIVKGLLNQSAIAIHFLTKTDALELAAESGHRDVVRELCAHAGNRIPGENLGMALGNAAGFGYLEIVQDLLTLYANRIPNWHKGQALIDAAENNHLPIVKEFISRMGQEISEKDKGLALEGAARYNCPTIVEALLNLVGKEIPIAYKGTALYRASLYGHIAIAKDLLTRFGQAMPLWEIKQALRAANIYNHLEIVKLLIDKGIPEKDKLSVFSSAAMENHLNLVRELLATANAEFAAEALLWSVKQGMSSIIKEVVDKAGPLIAVEDKINAIKRIPRIHPNHKEMLHLILEQGGVALSEHPEVVKILAEIHCFSIQTSTLHQYATSRKRRIRESEIKLLLNEAKVFCQAKPTKKHKLRAG